MTIITFPIKSSHTFICNYSSITASIFIPTPNTPTIPVFPRIPGTFGATSHTYTRVAVPPPSPAVPLPVSFLNPGKFRSSCSGQGQRNRRERLEIFPPLRLFVSLCGRGQPYWIGTENDGGGTGRTCDGSRPRRSYRGPELSEK